jgi:hypothetical protein
VSTTGGEAWRLRDFEKQFDEWMERDPQPVRLRHIVQAWVVTRYVDPYEGVRQQEGFDNLWAGKVPGTEDGCGHAVSCSYWIEESTHTVKCNSFAILGEPII